MKKMQCEKDEFAGHNIALKEEVEIYKVICYLIASMFVIGPYCCMPAYSHHELLPFVHDKMTNFTMSSLLI